MQTPLVSIIIPTYNRAHLIGETLDSVLAQTYTNWECIVVDDGSTDNTDELLATYCVKDSRFQYHHRPKDRQKGANACRNYGFELCKGEFVNWFDSDDLMMVNKLELQVKYILKNNYDFVISKTVDLLPEGKITPIQYQIVSKKISVKNFILQEIFWLTPDILVLKKVINTVKFNEELKSGQEYNYFVKMLIISTKGKFIDEPLTKRRIHNNSIQINQKFDKNKYRFNKYKVYLLTYSEIRHSVDKISLNHLLNMAMSKAFEMVGNKERIPNLDKLISAVLREKGLFKMLEFDISLIFSYMFKKGYSLMDYSRKYYK